MSTAYQPGFVEMLEMLGAHLRGRRADCPGCGSRRSVSVDTDKEVFNCFHAGCDFSGGVGALRKRLGIRRKWIPSDQYRAMMQRKARAKEAAAQLYQEAHTHELKLRERFRALGRLELAASASGSDCPEAWEVLADVYAERPQIERSLDELESGDVERIYAEVMVLRG